MYWLCSEAVGITRPHIHMLELILTPPWVKISLIYRRMGIWELTVMLYHAYVSVLLINQWKKKIQTFSVALMLEHY